MYVLQYACEKLYVSCLLIADTSDLFFDIREDGLGGCGLSEQGFARLWATTRGSSGVKGGRYYYEVKIEENVSVELPETEEHPHAIRYMHQVYACSK